MFSRKIIFGALVLLSCVFLFQCNKQSKNNQKVEVANAVAAARAGQFDKIDPKVMAEVLKLYKQPTLPPLTAPARNNGQPNSLTTGCNHCQQVLAQENLNTPATAQPVAEPHQSYIAPIEDKAAQQPVAAN